MYLGLLVPVVLAATWVHNIDQYARRHGRLLSRLLLRWMLFCLLSWIAVVFWRVSLDGDPALGDNLLTVAAALSLQPIWSLNGLVALVSVILFAGEDWQQGTFLCVGALAVVLWVFTGIYFLQGHWNYVYKSAPLNWSLTAAFAIASILLRRWQEHVRLIGLLSIVTVFGGTIVAGFQVYCLRPS